jgi:hypothetical protein
LSFSIQALLLLEFISPTTHGLVVVGVHFSNNPRVLLLLEFISPTTHGLLLLESFRLVVVEFFSPTTTLGLLEFISGLVVVGVLFSNNPRILLLLEFISNNQGLVVVGVHFSNNLGEAPCEAQSRNFQKKLQNRVTFQLFETLTDVLHHISHAESIFRSLLYYSYHTQLAAFACRGSL